jgi:uncharacterized protein YerC
MHNPQNAVLNTENEGIKKAAELISFENLTPEERSESKKKEAGLITIAKVEHNKTVEIAKNMLTEGEPIEKIAKYTGLSVEEIGRIVC